MKNKRALLYEILWNQILWLVPVLLVMLTPIWFLAWFGILWFTRHGFWPELLLISLGALVLVVALLFLVRYFRMPKVNHQCKEKAEREVETFIKTFKYEELSLSDTSRIIQELKNLNALVARCFGIRSKRPEMDIPLSYILRATSKISADLEQFIEEGTVLNLASETVSLNQILWFIPKGKPTGKNSGKVRKAEATPKSGILSSFVDWGLRKTVIKPLFTRLFELVGENSIAIYSGDFTPYKERTAREKATVVLPASGKFRRQNVFYHSHLLAIPLLGTLYVAMLVAGLSVGGVLYGRDALSTIPKVPPTSTSNVAGSTSKFSNPVWRGKMIRKHLPACAAILSGIILISLWLTFRLKMPALTVKPNPNWVWKDFEIFEKVQNHINDYSLKDLQGGLFFTSLREIVDQVDCAYSQSEKPSYKIRLSNLLKAQCILIGKAQRKIEEELPLIAYLRPADIRFGLWLNGLYQWAYKLYQKILWFDPVSATVLQLKLKLNQKMLGVFSRELVNSYKVYVLELCAYLLQEIYSRHLFYEPISILTLGHRNSDFQKFGLRFSSVPEAEKKPVSWKSFPHAWDSPGNTLWDRFRVHFRTPTLEENCAAFLKEAETEIQAADVILIPAVSEDEPEIGKLEESILREIGKVADSEKQPPLLIRIFAPERAVPISCFGWVVMGGSQEDPDFLKDFWRFMEENAEKITERQKFRYERDASADS